MFKTGTTENMSSKEEYLPNGIDFQKHYLHYKLLHKKFHDIDYSPLEVQDNNRNPRYTIDLGREPTELERQESSGALIIYLVGCDYLDVYIYKINPRCIFKCFCVLLYVLYLNNNNGNKFHYCTLFPGYYQASAGEISLLLVTL